MKLIIHGRCCPGVELLSKYWILAASHLRLSYKYGIRLLCVSVLVVYHSQRKKKGGDLLSSSVGEFKLFKTTSDRFASC